MNMILSNRSFRAFGKINAGSFLEYCLAFLLILNCNSVYGRMTDINLNIDLLIAAVSVLLLFTCVKSISKKAVQLVIVLYFFCIVYFTGSYASTNKTDFVLQFFVVLPCLIVYLTKSVKRGRALEIYRKTADIIFKLSVITSVVWFFSEIVPLLPLNTSITIDWGTKHTVQGVFGLFYECQTDATFGFDFYRNTGIFCEAPMNSLVMSFALMYEMFFREKFPKIKVVILCILIATTLSSTGFIFVITAFVVKYWSTMKKRKRSTKIIYFAGFIILIPVVYLILDRLFDTKSDTGSYMMRVIDYITGIYAFRDHPVFGVGYNNITPLYVYKSLLMTNYDVHSSGVGFSNSITGIFAQGGLILGLIYILPFVNLFVYAEKYKNINYRYFAILLGLLFVFTIFHARYIMIYFLASAYAVSLAQAPKKQTLTKPQLRKDRFKETKNLILSERR